MPQYRCREMPQSFSRNCTVRWPMPRALGLRGHDLRRRSVDHRPVYAPESTTRAGLRVRLGHRRGVERAAPSPSGWITTRIGRPYLRANSKSRWSCAGHAP